MPILTFIFRSGRKKTCLHNALVYLYLQILLKIKVTWSAEKMSSKVWIGSSTSNFYQHPLRLCAHMASDQWERKRKSLRFVKSRRPQSIENVPCLCISRWRRGQRLEEVTWAGMEWVGGESSGICMARQLDWKTGYFRTGFIRLVATSNPESESLTLLQVAPSVFLISFFFTLTFWVRQPINWHTIHLCWLFLSAEPAKVDEELTI